MSTASDDGEGALAHKIEQILDSIPHHESVCTDIQCAMQDHKPHRLQAKAAIEALLVRAQIEILTRAYWTVDDAEMRRIGAYDAQEAIEILQNKLKERLADLSISPQGQGVESLRDGEQQ